MENAIQDPGNLTFQLNPQFTSAAVHVEGTYKDTLILQIMLPAFIPFTHTPFDDSIKPCKKG